MAKKETNTKLEVAICDIKKGQITIADTSVTYDVVRNYGDLREMIMR